jgi:hypothetical protein
MRSLLSGLVFAATVATAAFAAPPAVGLQTFQGILCDTREQVQSLFDASKIDNGQGIIKVYLELNEQKDDKGEPACLLSPVRAIVDAVVDLGTGFSYTGERIHGWAVQVHSGENTGWVLFGELEASNS